MPPKDVENIFTGDLNARLGDPCNKRKKDMSIELYYHGLEDFTGHFTTRRWCRGRGRWEYMMHREGRQVTGRGDYVLGTA